MRKFWLTDHDLPVQTELFRIGHHNLRAASAGGVIFIPLVVAVAWSKATPAGLASWLTLALLANAAGWAAWLKFRTWHHSTAPIPASVLKRWMWTHCTVMGLMGGSTGAFGALYVQADPLHNLYMAAAFQGAVAYSAAGNSTHDLPAFLSSLMLGGLLMSVCIPNGFGSNAPFMIGLCWLFLGVLTWVAFQAHRSIVDTIELRLSHERLAIAHAEAAAQAQQASRDKSEFLAAASHDLRQPVHALMLLIEALKQQRKSPAPPSVDHAAQQDALITSMADAAQVISRLFNDLMELSRLESGHTVVLPEDIDLPVLLRELHGRHLAQAHKLGLRLRLRIGRSAEGTVVHTDRLLLERTLGNLLSNALRYTTQGGVLVTLRRCVNNQLQLAVQDTGVGIDAEDHDRIFAPYVQLGNAERDRSKGLGLGLAIVRQCLQRLDVPLQLQSRPGHGSRFTMLLPLSDRLNTASNTAPLEPLAPNDTGLEGRHLLLIDDDPLVRQAMGNLASSWGMDLRTATHADDPALIDLTHSPWIPDIVLCDYRMPGPIQGLALLSQLQERWPTCAGVLQTGEPSERVQDAAEEAGYPVLYKPVLPTLLRSTLRALLPPPGG